MNTDTKLSPDGRSRIEDWIGSDLDNAAAVEIIRTYNGFLVTARAGRDCLISMGTQALVFQDTESLCSWIENWHRATRVAP